MSPEQQRIAIAKVCDFYVLADDACHGGAFSLRHGREIIRGGWRDTVEEAWQDAPDYLKERDAIIEAIEAEILGNEGLEKRFLSEIGLILDRRADDETTCIYEHEMALLTAKPQELSEAFLRAVEKWEAPT